jgi:hypothetical protein
VEKEVKRIPGNLKELFTPCVDKCKKDCTRCTNYHCNRRCEEACRVEFMYIIKTVELPQYSLRYCKQNDFVDLVAG